MQVPLVDLHRVWHAHPCCADRDAEGHTFLMQHLFLRQATVVSAEAVIQAFARRRCLTGVDVLLSTRVSAPDYPQRDRVASCFSRSCTVLTVTGPTSFAMAKPVRSIYSSSNDSPPPL